MNNKNIVEQSVEFLRKPEIDLLLKTAIAYGQFATFEIYLAAATAYNATNSEAYSWLLRIPLGDFYRFMAITYAVTGMAWSYLALTQAHLMGRSASLPQIQAPIDNG